jgi:hypothetical protein
MNDEAIRRELAEHLVAVSDFSAHLSALAERLIDVGGVEQAGHLLVLDRIVAHRSTAFMASMGPAPGPDVDDDQQAAGKRGARRPRATGGGEHRHRFVDGKCIVMVGEPGNGAAVCGKAKGAGGRGNKKPDAAARTVPLSLTAPERSVASLARAADRFSSGGMGSSGTGDR